MNDIKKERLTILADILEKVPDKEQEKILFGLEMLAAAFETKKLSA